MPLGEIAEFVHRVVRQDSDGQWFIDYVNWQLLEQYHTAHAYEAWLYLRQLAHWISLGLRDEDIRVQDKYRWLARRYDESREGRLRIGVSPYATQQDLDRIKELPNLTAVTGS